MVIQVFNSTYNLHTLFEVHIQYLRYEPVHLNYFLIQVHVVRDIDEYPKPHLCVKNAWILDANMKKLSKLELTIPRSLFSYMFVFYFNSIPFRKRFLSFISWKLIIQSIFTTLIIFISLIAVFYSKLFKNSNVDESTEVDE